MRKQTIDRETRETQGRVTLNLDGSGETQIKTGIGFLDHFLTLMGFHAGFDLEFRMQGDVGVDDHHTVEDAGILLGQALDRSLGDRKGIARYGFFLLPMDEVLARVTVDISGRSGCFGSFTFDGEKIGDLILRRLTCNSALHRYDRNLVHAGETGYDQHTRRRLVGDDVARCLDATHTRHHQVHQHDVGPEPLRLRDRLLPIPSFPHDVDVRLGLQQRPDAFAHDRMG